MSVLTVIAGFVLLAGFPAVAFASSPTIVLLGELAIVAALVALAATGVDYLMSRAFAAHIRRNDDFHWH